MKHPEAFEFCKKLNARLPLPRNKQEADEFLKISPFWTHVDARNPKKSSNKAEWVDAEGKPLGNRPVYWQTGQPSANNPVAYYGASGSVASGKDTFSDKTLCVQEIVSGK